MKLKKILPFALTVATVPFVTSCAQTANKPTNNNQTSPHTNKSNYVLRFIHDGKVLKTITGEYNSKENPLVSTLLPEGYKLVNDSENLGLFETGTKDIQVVPINTSSQIQNKDSLTNTNEANSQTNHIKLANNPSSSPNSDSLSNFVENKVSVTSPVVSENNGSSDNHQALEQDDPTAFKSIKDLQSYYEQNSNLKQYKETPYPSESGEKSVKQIYHNLLDRHFGLITEYKNGPNSGGTLWLLDYKKLGTEQEQKYKLFFGTNYHVAVDLYRDDDQDIYKQDKRVSTNPLLTSAITFDVSWDQNPNVRSLVESQKYKRGYRNKRYARRFFKANQGFKIVFLGQNFMDRDAQPYDEKTNYYSDFTVLELEVDLSKGISDADMVYRTPADNPSARKVELENANLEWALISRHIQNSIKALDDSIKQFVGKPKDQLWLTDGSIPYATVNYQTFRHIKEKFLLSKDSDTGYMIPITEPSLTINNPKRANELSETLKNTVGDSNYYTKTQLFNAGFPYIVASQETRTSTNLPEYTYNTKVKDLPKSFPAAARDIVLVDYEYNGKAIADHGTEFNLAGKSLFYGVSYQQYTVTKPIGGISGSLTVDQNGLPIGLLWGNIAVSAGIDDKGQWAQYYQVQYAPFVQNLEFTTTHNSKKTTVYPYNLIDGTDKTKYPKQVHSYRERLEALYGKNYTTALFPKPKGN